MLEIKLDGKNPEYCAAFAIDKNDIQSFIKCNEEEAFFFSILMVQRAAEIMEVPVEALAYTIAKMPIAIPDTSVDLNLLSKALGKEF